MAAMLGGADCPVLAEKVERGHLESLTLTPWNSSSVQCIGDWVKEQGRILTAVTAGDDVVPIRA